MIRLENVLKTSLQDVLKISWRRLEDVFKTSHRRLENVFKTPWRRLEDVWPRRIYWSWSRRLEDVFWRPLSKANMFVLIKTSSRRLEDVFWRRRRKTSSRRLEDVFIKTNVCWTVSACANEPPGFSVRGTSTPNGLFQTINGSINNFLLTIEISYCLFFTYVKILRSTITWMENLPHVNKFFTSFFSSTSAIIRMPKRVHVWLNLTMKFPFDIHNYAELKGLVNSLS